MRTHVAIAILGAAFVLPVRLVAAEDEPAPEAESQALFDQLDANRDGKVTTEEVPEDKARQLRRIIRRGDRDGNGELTRDEFVAGLAEPAVPVDPFGGGPAGRPGFSGGPFDIEGYFKRLDTNGDGKATLEEIPEDRRATVERTFRVGDANVDGALTVDELRQLGPLRAVSLLGFPGGRQGAGMFAGAALMRAIDANGDGTISAEEIAGAAEALKKLDRDGDGELAFRELAPPGGFRPGQPGGTPQETAGGPEAFARRLKERDANGDGKLSRDEAPEPLLQIFDRIDKNGDGDIDEAELRDGITAIGRPGQGPPGEGQPGANPPTAVPAEILQRLKQADADGDGKLSADEAPNRLKEQFGEFDKNGDGFIDGAEIQARFRGGPPGGTRP